MSSPGPVSPGTSQVFALGGMSLRRPARDLGATDPRLTGVYSPGYSESEIAAHVHDVFLKDAEAYLRFSPVNRAAIDQWRDLVKNALGDYSPRTIIDIGSGAGATALAAAETFETAQVVASDLALPMLIELKNYADREGYRNVTAVQMNAEDLVFEDSQADLLTGAFILHHALSLENIFAEAFRVLGTGKKALFWEPFEYGSQMLARVFEYWDEMNPYKSDQFKDEVIDGLRIFLADLNRRVGRNKPIDLLAQIDDKWHFTRKHIYDLAHGAGFSDCLIRNIYSGDRHVLQSMARLELERRGFGWDDVPNWAQEKLKDVESKLSIEFLDDSPFCCTILLTK